MSVFSHYKPERRRASPFKKMVALMFLSPLTAFVLAILGMSYVLTYIKAHGGIKHQIEALWNGETK